MSQSKEKKKSICTLSSEAEYMQVKYISKEHSTRNVYPDRDSA